MAKDTTKVINSNERFQKRNKSIGLTDAESTEKLLKRAKKAGLGIEKAFNAQNNGTLDIDQDTILCFGEIKNKLLHKKELLKNQIKISKGGTKQLGFTTKKGKTILGIPEGDRKKNMKNRIEEYQKLIDMGNVFDLTADKLENEIKTQSGNIAINDSSFTTNSIQLGNIFGGGTNKLEYNLLDNKGNEVKLDKENKFTIKAKSNTGEEKEFTVKGLKINDQGELELSHMTFDPSDIDTEDTLNFFVKATYSINNTNLTDSESNLYLHGLKKISHTKKIGLKLKKFNEVNNTDIDTIKASLDKSILHENKYIDMPDYNIIKTKKQFQNYYNDIGKLISRLDSFDMAKIDRTLFQDIQKIATKIKKKLDIKTPILDGMNSMATNGLPNPDLTKELEDIRQFLEGEIKSAGYAVDKLTPYTAKYTRNPLKSFNIKGFIKPYIARNISVNADDSSYVKMISNENMEVRAKADENINDEKINYGTTLSIASRKWSTTINYENKDKKIKNKGTLIFSGNSLSGLLKNIQTNNQKHEGIRPEQYGYIKYKTMGEIIKKTIENANERGYNLEYFDQETQMTKKLSVEKNTIKFDVTDSNGNKNTTESFEIDTNFFKNTTRYMGESIRDIVVAFNSVMNYRYKEHKKIIERRFMTDAGHTRHIALGLSPLKRIAGVLNRRLQNRNKNVKFSFEKETIQIPNGKTSEKGDVLSDNYHISFKNNLFSIAKNDEKPKTSPTLGSLLNMTDRNNKYLFAGKERLFTHVVYKKFIEALFNNPAVKDRAYYYFDQLTGKTYICSWDMTQNKLKFGVVKQKNLNILLSKEGTGINKTVKTNMENISKTTATVQTTKEKIKDFFHTDISKMPGNNYGYITKKYVDNRYEETNGEKIVEEINGGIEESNLMNNPLILGSIFKAADKARYEGIGMQIASAGLLLPYLGGQAVYQTGKLAFKGINAAVNTIKATRQK